MIRSRTLVARFVFAVALFGLQQLATEPAAAVKRRAFVTSEVGSGNLNLWPQSGGLVGVAAGDNICRVLAGDAGLPNASTYRPGSSTAATIPAAMSRVRPARRRRAASARPSGRAVVPGRRCRPLHRHGGRASRGGAADLPADPLRRDGKGHLSENAFGYWSERSRSWKMTRTAPPPQDNCASWVVGEDGLDGRTDSQSRTTVDWTRLYTTPCDSTRRLLCLEPGASETTPVPWIPAALTFATSASGAGDLGDWPEAAGEVGLAAGDAICRNLAAAAHLPSPEEFFAWISSTTTDAGDRMTLEGVPIPPCRRLSHRRLEGRPLREPQRQHLSCRRARALSHRGTALQNLHLRRRHASHGHDLSRLDLRELGGRDHVRRRSHCLHRRVDVRRLRELRAGRPPALLLQPGSPVLGRLRPLPEHRALVVRGALKAARSPPSPCGPAEPIRAEATGTSSGRDPPGPDSPPMQEAGESRQPRSEGT